VGQAEGGARDHPSWDAGRAERFRESFRGGREADWNDFVIPTQPSRGGPQKVTKGAKDGRDFYDFCAFLRPISDSNQVGLGGVGGGDLEVGLAWAAGEYDGEVAQEG
jgi:hypothetical protein